MESPDSGVQKLDEGTRNWKKPPESEWRHPNGLPAADSSLLHKVASEAGNFSSVSKSREPMRFFKFPLGSPALRSVSNIYETTPFQRRETFDEEASLAFAKQTHRGMHRGSVTSMRDARRACLECFPMRAFQWAAPLVPEELRIFPERIALYLEYHSY